MRKILQILLLCVLCGCVKNSDYNLNHQNVVWTVPSEDSFGSMPLGNGDIGMNIWAEPNGDILFYISKVNAFDYQHLLPKLGKVRLSFTPSLSLDNFRQELSLHDASVKFLIDDVALDFYVAANQPLIHLEASSKVPRVITCSLEPVRPLADSVDVKKGTAGVLLPSASDRLTWAYVNYSSDWRSRLESQTSIEFAEKIKDPILGRYSGCSMTGAGMTKEGKMKLKTILPEKRWQLDICVESYQPRTETEFVEHISRSIHFDKKAHWEYWKEFWSRSFINVISCGEDSLDLDQCRYTQVKQGALAYRGHRMLDAETNARQITQRYALERFCEAIASRGEVPPPYNGSIFTMDMPAGVLGFDRPKTQPVSPDARDWGRLSFMWQNTRHPYWSMAARGDYDCMIKGMEFVRDGLDICRERCREKFGHEGAFIMEASWWYNVGVFDWENVPQHLKYHMLASIEIPSIMCQYYEHTRDRHFLDSVLLPCADEFVKFYQLHYPRKYEDGKLLMENVGCAETYQGVTNPCTEIGCLKFLLEKLCSFDIDEKRKNEWSAYLSMMPDVPTRTVRGRKLLAVGDKYEPGRTNCESPELYSVYPFLQVWLGKPEMLDVARQSFHLRTISLDGTVDAQGVETGGWQSAPVQAAYLGLPREAARLVSINFNDKFVHWNDNIPLGTSFPNRPRARFPAFWECKMDGTPDNDHGANSVNALQSMLLQSDGDRILLLPAWPEDWDVSFQLKATNNTTVRCDYREGKVRKLEVTPREREKDIVNMAEPAYRVRTLIETAKTDYNYLYSLPPMLDAQPLGGPVTKDWLKKYGYTVSKCKAGPWPDALFHDNVVYVHLFDADGDTLFLPSIGRTLKSCKSVLGDCTLRQTDGGYLIATGIGSGHCIIEMIFDGDIESVVREQIFNKALNRQEELITQKCSDGKTIVEIPLSMPVAIGRFEFQIENPGHLRGNGREFQIESKDANGTWMPIYDGDVYGLICSKEISPVTTWGIRLIVDADKVSDFSIYGVE